MRWLNGWWQRALLFIFLRCNRVQVATHSAPSFSTHSDPADSRRCWRASLVRSHVSVYPTTTLRLPQLVWGTQILHKLHPEDATIGIVKRASKSISPKGRYDTPPRAWSTCPTYCLSYSTGDSARHQQLRGTKHEAQQHTNEHPQPHQDEESFAPVNFRKQTRKTKNT